MKTFAKFYAALTAGLLTWGTAVVVSDPTSITSAEWMSLAGVLVAAGAVLLIPNTPQEA